MMTKLLAKARVPDALVRRLSKYAVPITVLSALLLVGGALAVAAVALPGGLASGTRVSETKDIPLVVSGLGILQADRDRDGLGDALENFLYGSDPENWNSSGLGIPDGWLAQFGYDPLDPATASATGATPNPSTLPASYRGAWPDHLRLPLKAYYDVGAPAGYAPGESSPWWRGNRTVDPTRVDLSGSGIPTAWLVRYGLDPFDGRIGEKPAPGSGGRLSIREAFEHNTDPTKSDSDGDGLIDLEEINVHKTDPSRFSTSGCGIADGWLVHFGLPPHDPLACARDGDMDGLSNLEEFRWSHERFQAEVRSEGVSVLYSRGLDPRNWETSGSGLPDGWYVHYGLDALSPAQADEIIAKASDYPAVRWLTEGPTEKHAAIPDLVMTVRDAYKYGRPSSWNEPVDGPWWGGTDPSALDTDSDGLPDAVEIRGWYVNLTLGTGPVAKANFTIVGSNPREADSDGDGLVDGEEYAGETTCGVKDAPVRRFPATDPRNKDTAFSRLTDLEKVCGIVRGPFRYDLYGKTTAQGGGLDPTRADSVGDYLVDGDRVEYWIARFERYQVAANYEWNESRYRAVTEWTKEYARFAGMSAEDVAREFRPDGDTDGDGIVNALDADPSGGLAVEKWPEQYKGSKRAVFLEGGLQIKPSLYRFSQYASNFDRPASDPANPDTDGDGLPDAWEIQYGDFSSRVGGWNLDPTKYRSDSRGEKANDAEENNDGDVVTWYSYRRAGDRIVRDRNAYDFKNLLEFFAGTDPNEHATPQNGVNDGVADGWKYFWAVVYPTLEPRGDNGGIGAVGDLGPDATRMQELSAALRPGQLLLDKGSKSSRVTRFLTLEGDCEKPALLTKFNDLQEEEGGRAAWEAEPSQADISCVTNYDGKKVNVIAIAGNFPFTYRAESELGTNPYRDDTDGDGMPDAWEAHYRVGEGDAASPNPVNGDSDANPDGDRLRHLDEHLCGTSPWRSDTDRDAINDDLEVQAAGGASLCTASPTDFLGRQNPLDPNDVDRYRAGGTDSDRDGLADSDELAGQLFQGKRIPTDPAEADTDGDGLIDGTLKDLNTAQTADKAKSDEWRARGLAWTQTSTNTNRFLGEGAFVTNPILADTSEDGIPDGWGGYYFTIGRTATAPDKANPLARVNYNLHKPDWWQERQHGVWWWGASPNLELRQAVDLDNDGLNDLNGEDPFPASRFDNRYQHGAFATTNPHAVRGYVEAGASAREVRERAQALGAEPGNPVKHWTATAGMDANANGIPDARDRARTEILLDPLGAGAAPDAQNGGFVVEKGRAFTVKGRLVLAETKNGQYLNGDSATARKGVPNAPVIASLLGPRNTTIIGVAFTDAEGRFEIKANITSRHEATIPHEGITLLGHTKGKVAWRAATETIGTGLFTRDARNTLHVWTYNTSANPPAGHPQRYEWRAVLANQNGIEVEATTRGVAGALAAPVPLSIRSSTKLAFDLPQTAPSGSSLTGTVTLADAAGAPLSGSRLKFVWQGTPGGAVVNFRKDGSPIRTDEEGKVNLSHLPITVSADKSGAEIAARVREAFGLSGGIATFPNEAPRRYGLLALFESDDPYLEGTNRTSFVSAVIPTALKVASATPDVIVGGPIRVVGSLEMSAFAVPGHEAFPGGPVPRAQIRVEVGSASEFARTDDQGRFAIDIVAPEDLPPGETEIKLAFAGSPTIQAANARSPLVVKRTAAIEGLGESVAPRGGDVRLTGFLKDNRGEGISNALLALKLDGGAVIGTGLTRERGAFTIRAIVPETASVGPHTVVATFAGDASYAAASNSTLLKVIAPTRIALQSDTASAARGAFLRVEGQLLTDRGEPVTRQAVEAFFQGVNAAYGLTDDAGRFEVRLLLNASERLGEATLGLAYSPPPSSAYRPATASVAVKIQSAVRVAVPDKDVHRGFLTVDGALLDDRGSPVSGATVRATWNGAAIGEARTSRAGEFRIPYALPESASVGPAAVRVLFGGNERFAPASADARYTVTSATRLAIGSIENVVRGEPLRVTGFLAEDNGKPLEGSVTVSIGRVALGSAKAANGKIDGTFRVPTDLERGRQDFVVRYAGSDGHEAARVTLPILVKIRAKVEADVPRVAFTGLAFEGSVTIKDDRGEPLRNATVVYTFADGTQPIYATTTGEGRADLAGVPHEAGNAVFSVSVRAGSDVVPTTYETASIRVLGVGTGAGLGLLLVLLALLLAGSLAVGAYLRFRKRQLQDVRGILDEAIEGLLAGNEYEGVIFLAYRKLVAHLAAFGFTEKESETPREFVIGVRRAIPVSRENLKRLVKVFEEARYSDHAVGPRQRDDAMAALTGVRGELDAILGKPAPGALKPEASR